MNEFQVSHKRRHRGAILQFVYTNHSRQLGHMDDVMLWGLMLDMSFSIGQDEVLTLLQDLKVRGYLNFEESKNRLTGRTKISRIELTAAGSDIVERLREDAAVLVP